MKKILFVLAICFSLNTTINAQGFVNEVNQKLFYPKSINQISSLDEPIQDDLIQDLNYWNSGYDDKNMVTFSPFRIFLARINLKYERVTGKSLTWGTRLEYGGIYQSLFINPFVRLYFFDTEATGLYTEFGAYGRNQFISENDPLYLDEISSGAGLRLHLGIQFMVGKKQNKPVDFSLFAQFDSSLEEYSRYDFDEESWGNLGIATMGPAPILGFRLQTGLKFK